MNIILIELEVQVGGIGLDLFGFQVDGTVCYTDALSRRHWLICLCQYNKYEAEVRGMK